MPNCREGTRALTVAAIAVLVAGCSTNTPTHGATGASSGSVQTGTKDLHSPTLTSASTAVTQEFSGRTANVPGPNGSGLNVVTTPLTTGTLTSVKAADGKTYTAPDGKALVAVRVRASANAEETHDHGGLTGYTKPTSVTITAGGTTSHLTDLSGGDLLSGKAWIVAVPNSGRDAKLTLNTDGGQQVVTLDTGKRDDAASNGLPLGSSMTVPVADTAACEAITPKPRGDHGATAADPLTCTATWTLRDHLTGVGWAPKGGAFLVLDSTLTVPALTLKTGAGAFDTEDYPDQTGFTIKATLDGASAKKAQITDMGLAGVNARVVYPSRHLRNPAKRT